jgi:hypothetical protein
MEARENPRLLSAASTSRRLGSAFGAAGAPGDLDGNENEKGRKQLA